ncbi:MAG: VOC family protein [Hyphomicrobiales bacterium]|nr:VOC family protein [Hyphomicrobiales bacterium]
MIELIDIFYVRLGAPDMAAAEDFATRVLGLQVGDRGGKAVYLRSDDRAHTLCDYEGDPREQTVAFEVRDAASLDAAASALESIGHAVHCGTVGECAARKVRGGMVFEYSVGVEAIADEATRRPRQFGFEPTSLCMWGSKSNFVPM